MGKCLLFLFCLFFITPLISINKACVVFFSVTDQLEKIHMLNQMGEINSFIKLILKLPVLQCHQGRHGFDCATVRIRTLKNVQQEQFYFRLTIYFFFFYCIHWCRKLFRFICRENTDGEYLGEFILIR